MSVLRYRLQRRYARLHTKYFASFFFVHINKTGGTSIERALGLPFQHRTALQIRADAGLERWERRFSFAFVRNPWDKVSSHYHFRVKTNQTALRENPVSFQEWVRLAYGAHDPRYYDQPMMFMPQTHWICDEKGRMLVDFVGRFERLEADFQEVCQRLDRKARLPHLKGTRHDYRELYSDDTAEIVARAFAEDLERFGYRFDPAGTP